MERALRAINLCIDQEHGRPGCHCVDDSGSRDKEHPGPAAGQGARETAEGDAQGEKGLGGEGPRGKCSQVSAREEGARAVAFFLKIGFPFKTDFSDF